MNEIRNPHNPSAGLPNVPIAESFEPEADAASRGSSSHADEPTRLSDVIITSRAHDDGQPSISGYEIIEELHRGGQGVVYRALQLGTKRKVALKVLLEGPFASETARHRFEREIELAASLRHANIVTILDSGSEHGRYFFAMELIDGLRLDQYLKKNNPPLRQTLLLLEKICGAVSFAHQRGVIHRDLKPSNILIDADGEPHVLDFGLAKVERSSDPRETTVQVLSTTGQVIGTLAYMSPEQAAGAQEVTVRSDVYSLGVIFYEALLGRTPYPVSGPLGDVLNRIARDEPVRPRSLRSISRFGKLIDDELETILLKALEKDPARRYETAGDLGRDLRHYLADEPIEAKRASGFYMLKKTLLRYRLQAGAAGVVLFMLIAFLVLFAMLYRKEKAARAEAEQLRQLTNDKAQKLAIALDDAASAQRRESEARHAAESNERQAMQSAEELRAALVRQKVQRGDLAQLRGDLAEARDSYWDAFDDQAGAAAARWQLRQYYVQSGDVGASQLYYRSFGPAALSGGGAVAAVCDAPHSISVREVATGRTRRWIPAPGAVRALDVSDDGWVAAAGDNWLCLWPPEGSGPSCAAELPPTQAVQSVHIAAGGAVFVVGDQDVRYFRGSATPAAVYKLAAELTGAAAYSEELGMLAAPTGAGVVLLSLGPDGELAAQTAWTGAADRTAKAVRFVDGELLAILSDVVDLVLLRGDEHGQAMQFLAPQQSWDMVDLRRGIGAIALGSRDGRVAIYRSGELEAAWRLTQGRLESLRLTPDGQTLVTLDDRGSVTSWTPGLRSKQQAPIHKVPAETWCTSGDGSTLLLVDREGQFVLHRQATGRTEALTLPSLFELLAGRRAEGISLSLNRDGSRAALAYAGRIWLKDTNRPRASGLRWTSEAAPVLREAVLSSDGKWLALHGQSVNGDRHVVRLQPAEERRRPPLGRGGGPRPGGTHGFTGAAIRTLRFVPGGTDLLVARSNGEIHLLHPPEPGPRDDGASERQEPWAVLDAPAYQIAFDRGGTTLAAACDDGVIRLISVLDTSELGRINLPGVVRSLEFNADGDVLLATAADGGLSLFEVATQERILQRPAGDRGPRVLAAWLGDQDAIVLSDAGGVHEIEYRQADELIERNRSYARQRQVARHLGDADFSAAWAEALALRELNEPLGRDAQETILDQLLRRLRGQPDEAWLQAVLGDAEPRTQVRLAHAAYDGGRFELARGIFAAAATTLADKLDAGSARRLAECEYLLGDPRAAADALGGLLRRTDAVQADPERVQLEYVAALALAGRAEEARARVQARSSLQGVPARDPVASLAAEIIADVLIERASSPQLSTAQKALLSMFAEPWLQYRDDIEFFLGEAARARGDVQAARQRYQHCLDVTRDEWPANWARFRLTQLGDRAL